MPEMGVGGLGGPSEFRVAPLMGGTRFGEGSDRFGRKAVPDHWCKVETSLRRRHPFRDLSPVPPNSGSRPYTTATHPALMPALKQLVLFDLFLR